MERCIARGDWRDVGFAIDYDIQLCFRRAKQLQLSAVLGVAYDETVHDDPSFLPSWLHPR